MEEGELVLLNCQAAMIQYLPPIIATSTADSTFLSLSLSSSSSSSSSPSLNIQADHRKLLEIDGRHATVKVVQ
jgi:hypothetical protein